MIGLRPSIPLASNVVDIRIRQLDYDYANKMTSVQTGTDKYTDVNVSDVSKVKA